MKTKLLAPCAEQAKNKTSKTVEDKILTTCFELIQAMQVRDNNIKIPNCEPKPIANISEVTDLFIKLITIVSLCIKDLSNMIEKNNLDIHAMNRCAIKQSIEYCELINYKAKTMKWTSYKISKSMLEILEQVDCSVGIFLKVIKNNKKCRFSSTFYKTLFSKFETNLKKMQSKIKQLTKHLSMVDRYKNSISDSGEWFCDLIKIVRDYNYQICYLGLVETFYTNNAEYFRSAIVESSSNNQTDNYSKIYRNRLIIKFYFRNL